MGRLLSSLALLLALGAAFGATGGLGDPAPRGFVTFDAIRSTHFDAIAVYADDGATSTAPLQVHVHLMGDAADADLAPAEGFLRSRFNVEVVPDPDGVPLFLTHENLVATSGPAALGATISSGIAAEIGDGPLDGCVVAHEILHFVGLHHDPDPSNIMYARCGADKTAWGTVTAEQVAFVAGVKDIRALTTHGMRTWAERA